MDYDTWLEAPYQDRYNDNGDIGEFEFNAPLRKGTVKVKAHTCMEYDFDETTGKKMSCLSVALDSVTWSFNDEHDVDLTDQEEDELKALGHKDIGIY